MDRVGASRRSHRPRQNPVPLVLRRRSEYTITWDEYIKEAETGDILLFSGQSLISTVIKVAQMFSSWSHIGMVVREEGGGRVWLWESTTADGNVDVITGLAKDGPRLVDAESAIYRYVNAEEDVKVIVRKVYIDERYIGNGPSQINPVAKLPALIAFMRKVSTLHYERNMMELARAGVRELQLVYASRDNSSYFCSELIAEAYMILGLLPRDSTRHASMYTPADFARPTESLMFAVDMSTGEALVGLGPHINLVFPDTRPDDPLDLAPGDIRYPSRPKMRVTGIPKSSMAPGRTTAITKKPSTSQRHQTR